MRVILQRLFALFQIFLSLFRRYEYPVPSSSIYRGRSVSQLLPPVVETSLGVYEGYFMQVLNGRWIYAFEGIQYAEPPERFKAPTPKKSFHGKFSAKAPGSHCLQTYYFTVVNPGSYVFGDENCLACDIFTPQLPGNETRLNLPVILNLYGGSFAVGSKNDYGPAYLLERDIILVNCNWRIGVYGFLSSGDSVASGNWGLKDAALAVDFVHSHISSFGGDPTKIVLYGQSAGAAIVHLLLLNPTLKGKVYAAMCFSGSALSWFAISDPVFATRLTKSIALLSFCPINQGSQVMVDCLKKVKPRRLAYLQNLVHVTDLAPLQFHPVIEPPHVPGSWITDSPENIYATKPDLVVKVPMIFASNSRETELAFMILKSRKWPVELFLKLNFELLPYLLEYNGRVQGRERSVTKEIFDFYGGFDGMKRNVSRFFDMLHDRLIRTGMSKSYKAHSKVAPTYTINFAYKSSRGFAAKLHLNPLEYEVSHGEEIISIFNRTDFESVSHDHEDYRIVKLMEDIFENFSQEGMIAYTAENGSRIYPKQIEPFKPTFPQLIINNEGVKVKNMDLDTEITKFWESLGIIQYPSYHSPVPL